MLWLTLEGGGIIYTKGAADGLLEWVSNQKPEFSRLIHVHDYNLDYYFMIGKSEYFY